MMDIRALKPEERNYTYSQSQQISMQTGCIGHLRADMDSNGEGFFSSWDDFRKDLKTQEFKEIVDSGICHKNSIGWDFRGGRPQYMVFFLARVFRHFVGFSFSA